MVTTGAYLTIDDKIKAIKASGKVSPALKEAVQEIKLGPLQGRVGAMANKGMPAYKGALALEFNLEGDLALAPVQVFLGRNTQPETINVYHVLIQGPHGYEPLKGIFYRTDRDRCRIALRTGISGVFQLAKMTKVKKMGTTFVDVVPPMRAWYGQFFQKEGERTFWRANPTLFVGS